MFTEKTFAVWVPSSCERNSWTLMRSWSVASRNSFSWATNAEASVLPGLVCELLGNFCPGSGCSGNGSVRGRIGVGGCCCRRASAPTAASDERNDRRESSIEPPKPRYEGCEEMVALQATRQVRERRRYTLTTVVVVLSAAVAPRLMRAQARISSRSVFRELVMRSASMFTSA